VRENTENKHDDQILVKKILSGESSAFSTIISNTEGLVAQIVFKMIPGKENRKDIAQDVYLKAFQSLSGFRYQSKISTWIAQICYNTCINYLEKRKLVFPDNHSTGEYSDDEILELLSTRNGPQYSETENIIFQKDLSEILKCQLDKLSPVYKTLITLYHNEELSYSEIAEITGLPEGTIKNYLFRARKELRDNILQTYKKEAL
jgi:RNA polymerase sigma-70 factor (ECF subfamily)